MSSFLFYIQKNGTIPPLENPVGLNYSALEQGGALPGTPNFDYPTARESDFAFFATKGIRNIRLPIKWERLQPTINGDFDTTYLGFIDQAVTYAKNHGMTIMLDVHNYGGRSVDGVYRKFGTPELPDSAFADLWLKIATYYLNEPGMEFYDLMNEPNTMPTLYVWTTAAQAAITAIRAAGFNGYIHVEAGGFSGAHDWISSGSAAAFRTLTDPQNKLIAHCHQYLDSDNSGTGDTAVTGKGSTVLVNATNYARTYGIKMFIGEYGIANTQSMYTEGAAMLDYMNANSDVWIGRAVWAGGPAWPDSYIKKVEPAGFTAPIVDKPQIPLIYSKHN